MPDFSLVPVDHQPGFDDPSLVPVDHDPFSADDMIQQARTQLESQPQRLSAGAAPIGADTIADRAKMPLVDDRSQTVPGDSYPTADAAAIAALRNISSTSQRRGLEYAGRIYKTWLGLGDYSYTPPIEGEAFSSSPGSKVLVPLPHSFGINAGTYHTHTRGMDPARDERYSPHDAEISDGEGAPSYLGTPTGMIYKYSPDTNQASQGNISLLGNMNGLLNTFHTQLLKPPIKSP
jgi:hypothetical protein